MSRKQLCVLILVFGFVLVGWTSASAIRLCDNSGFVWNLSYSPSTGFLTGTVDGTCARYPVYGMYDPTRGTYAMSALVDPGTGCISFSYLGSWGGGSGSGTFYNALGGSGGFNLGICASDSIEESPGPAPDSP